MYKVQHNYQEFWTTVLESKDMVSCLLSASLFAKLKEYDRDYRVVDQNGAVCTFEHKRQEIKNIKGFCDKVKYTMEVFNCNSLAYLYMGTAKIKGKFWNNKFTAEDGTIYHYHENQKTSLVREE